MFALEPTAVIEDEPWRIDARCADGTSALVDLFFSEQLDDILRAKAFCVECPVKDECLAAAVERREPWGVWGGELFANGKVLAHKRRRGRPPKVAPPEPVLEELVPRYDPSYRGRRERPDKITAQAGRGDEPGSHSPRYPDEPRSAAVNRNQDGRPTAMSRRAPCPLPSLAPGV